MSWRHVAASQVGTSHIANGTACQDSCWAQVLQSAKGWPLLTIFVSDGAGSASRGGEGSELAIQAAADVLVTKLAEDDLDELNEPLAIEMVVAVRQAIRMRASSLGLKPRDFACTFLGLLSLPGATLVMQVGDGAVVLDVGNGLEVAITPMSGEYANMTHFATDEDCLENLQLKSYRATAQRVGAFSDGLQRLALNMAANTPHEPFFARFFDTLAKTSPEDEEQLHAALKRFLESPAVNERSDDDKTLALAVLV